MMEKNRKEEVVFVGLYEKHIKLRRNPCEPFIL